MENDKKTDLEPKKAGRPPGMKNKRTSLNKTLKQWFIDKKVHPMDMINELIREQKKLIDQMDTAESKAKAYSDITKTLVSMLPYVFAKMRETEADDEAIDVSPENQKAIDQMTPEELMNLVRKV